MPDTSNSAAKATEKVYRFSAQLTARSREGRKGHRTRTAIQIALCDCLDSRPLSELTIARICKGAAISQGTFYIYFPNRDAAVAELLMHFTTFLQARMRHASHLDPGNPTRAATRAYVRLFRQNLGLMKCLLRDLGHFPEARDAFQTLNREWLETVVASVENRHRQTTHPAIPDHDELMRRAYALGGMTDQYLAGLFLDHDPNMMPFSQDIDAVINTLDLLWVRGMQP